MRGTLNKVNTNERERERDGAIDVTPRDERGDEN
jgi:hypothetical protein